jgi:hypothetical protein
VVSGTVRIGNGGDVAGRFSVVSSGSSDTPGPFGGRLSGHVVLELREVAGGAEARTLYSGAPAELGEVELGVFAPGEERDYALVAWLPEGVDDNLYQAASMAIGIEWRAAPVAVATPTPTPTVTPGPTVTQTPTPEPPIVVIEVVELDADGAGLPSASGCLRRKKVRFRLRRPWNVGIQRVVVRVNRKRAGRARGRYHRKIVANFRRVKSRRARVKVLVWTADGQRYRVRRTYRMCRRA